MVTVLTFECTDCGDFFNLLVKKKRKEFDVDRARLRISHGSPGLCTLGICIRAMNKLRRKDADSVKMLFV